MRFFHGTYEKLENGITLSGREEEYEKDWSNTDFYKILELFRPEEMISHKSGVFLCHHPDDIDAAGGGTDYICEMKPVGKIQRHDMNWSSEISSIMSDGYDLEKIEKAASNYWKGVAYGNGKDSLWEYIAEGALVLSCHSFDSAFIEDDIPENISDAVFDRYKNKSNNTKKRP